MTRLCCALSLDYIIIPPIAGLKGVYIRDSRKMAIWWHIDEAFEIKYIGMSH